MRVEAHLFEHIDSRALDVENQLKRLGHSIRQAGQVPPLECFRTTTGSVCCIVVAVDSTRNGLDYLFAGAGNREHAFGSVIRCVESLHRRTISVWPRRLEEVILVHQNNRMYASGIGFAQATWQCRFSPEEDVQMLVELHAKWVQPGSDVLPANTSMADLLQRFSPAGVANDEDDANKGSDPGELYMQYLMVWTHCRLFLNAEQAVLATLAKQVNGQRPRVLEILSGNGTNAVRVGVYDFHQALFQRAETSDVLFSPNPISTSQSDLPDVTNKLTSLFFQVAESLTTPRPAPSAEKPKETPPARSPLEFVNEDIRRLFGDLSNTSDGFNRKSPPSLENFPWTHGAFPPGLRSTVWQTIASARLGWPREVFFHAYEISKEICGREFTQLMHQLDRDLPRCHSYRSSGATQEALRRVLWAWQWFDLAEFERADIDFDSLTFEDATTADGLQSEMEPPAITIQLDLKVLEPSILVEESKPEGAHIDSGLEMNPFADEPKDGSDVALTVHPFDSVLDEMQTSSALFLSQADSLKDAADSEGLKAAEDDVHSGAVVDTSPGIMATPFNPFAEDDPHPSDETIDDSRKSPAIQSPKLRDPVMTIQGYPAVSTSGGGVKRQQYDAALNSPIPVVKQSAALEIDRNPNETPRRGYWQGLDSIAMAVLLGCDLDEVAALQCLNAITHISLRNRVFMAGKSDVELLGGTLEGLLRYFHPSLLASLEEACEEEPLRNVCLPWLLACFCHSLPLTSASKDALWSIVDQLIMGDISIPLMCASLLMQWETKLAKIRTREDLRRVMATLPESSTTLIPLAIKASLNLKKETPFDATDPFLVEETWAGMIFIPLAALIEGPDKFRTCLIIGLDAAEDLPPSVMRVPLRSDLLKGLDLLSQDGDIIVSSLVQRRKVACKLTLLITGGREGSETSDMAKMLLRALHIRKIPRCCLLV